MAYQCTKRPYYSRKSAKRAHRMASWRVRLYWCDCCRAWHVTNNEKIGRRRYGGD